MSKSDDGIVDVSTENGPTVEYFIEADDVDVDAKTGDADGKVEDDEETTWIKIEYDDLDIPDNFNSCSSLVIVESESSDDISVEEGKHYLVMCVLIFFRKKGKPCIKF